MSAEIIICVCYNCPLVEPKSNSPPLIPKYRRPSCTICYSPPANYHIVRLSLSLSNAKRRFHPILSPHLHIMCFITFMDISNANFINHFWEILQKLGIRSTPPILVGTKSQLFPKISNWELRKNCRPEKRQSHMGRIYLNFLHCAFPNVS